MGNIGVRSQLCPARYFDRQPPIAELDIFQESIPAPIPFEILDWHD
ncbi:hypothetical protein QUB68_05960 [Microcoleus sp. A006_D1]